MDVVVASNPELRASTVKHKVCHYWRAGRCNRHPCQFIHAELPRTTTAGSNVDTATPSSKKPMVCKYFLAGNCKHGDKCRFLHKWFIGDDASFSLVAPLQGHQKSITGIALPSGSDKLYSGSKDGSVRVWDCTTGQCVQEMGMGGEVGCLICEGCWIFAAVPNAVKVWNTQSQTELVLDITQSVCALAVSHDLLFAGTIDGSILVWKFNAAANCFEAATCLRGHGRTVVSLAVGGANKLYSASMDNTIKVWDILDASFQCVQTLTEHTSVVMSLVCWDQFLISCSLDNTIKVWAKSAQSSSIEVCYTHSEEHGVLALAGMPDDQGKPVLLCALNDDTVRVYDLPSFKERGKMFGKQEVRRIQPGPHNLFFTGDGAGDVRIWKWSSTAS